MHFIIIALCITNEKLFQHTMTDYPDILEL